MCITKIIKCTLQAFKIVTVLLIVLHMSSVPIQAQSSSQSLIPILSLLLLSDDDPVEPVELVETVAGSGHSCARLLDGSAKCWGYNEMGHLGDGTTTTRLTPVAVVCGDQQRHRDHRRKCSHLCTPGGWISKVLGI